MGVELGVGKGGDTMFAIFRMKTPVALVAGMFLLLGSSPLMAGVACDGCLGGAAPMHILYCEPKNVVLCEDCNHGKDWIESSKSKIPESAKQADWGQKYVRNESWTKTPYETTFSPVADRYQLVVAKLEVKLSPIAMSFRLPRFLH